ncbi:hypothetical protein [Paenibacillus assamensis]|uniref:hypothetical protein n=1 Tax=Paenibacillus assamensis TaxID=311244 RepID=UPI000426077E|nr:hypothetical protein [Paenibacillus assamensis]
MQNKRWTALVATMAVSSIVLFGGWSFYRHQMIETPLQSTIQQIDTVQQAKVVWGPKQVTIELSLEPGADVRTVVQDVKRQANREQDKRNISIKINNEHTTPELERWWSQALFPVTEAMAHRSYGDIPIQLNKLAEGSGVAVKTEMDNEYVYVTLTAEKGKGSKVLLLPLNGESMGVWPNEQSNKTMA